MNSQIKTNKKIGFTCSTFDLLHAGHVAMLQEAKTVCDYLIVGLQNDPSTDRPTKNKPVQSIVERQLQLDGSKYVDEIWIYNTEKDLEDLLLTLPIDVRILGVEYEGKEFTGREICHKRNIELFFNGRDHSFSSSGLRRRVYEAELAKDQNAGTS
jgi:glycerol-3-phosphate cytidylyltransferase